MGFSFDLFLWKTLSKKSCIIFGEECASVIVWIFICLLLRTITIFTKLQSYIPQGLIFGFPLFIQLISSFIPNFKNNSPILTVRLAESLLGKTNPTRIFVLIPAHFIGSIVAIVLFRSVFFFLPSEVFYPISYYNDTFSVKTLASEVLANFLYTLVILVLPYLLDVNRLSTLWINLPLLPLITLLSDITFNSGVVYGLWYVQSCSVLTSVGSLPSERIIGPIVGAALAAILCNRYFPDDPLSWSRKRQ